MLLPQITCGNVFLTGATGVLGAHMLKELLATSDSDVYCLVRAPDDDAARERLRGFLAVYDQRDELRGEFLARVKPVLGDITRDDMGLTPAAYAELAERIDVTIHSAANTNLFARWNTIEPINVGGARNIIRFAMQTAQRYLVYVSTYTVMGDRTFDRDLTFRETDLDVGQGFDHMTYQQSKFIAETMVHAAAKEGLLYKIIRPGQIFGEGASGAYPQGQTNVSGLFYDIFKTIIESGVALYSDTFYDITPVDYVSKAAVFLALAEKTFQRTYHLTNPHPKTYTQITNILQDFGYPIEIVSQDEYKRLLFDRAIRVDGVEYKSSTTSAFKWWFRRPKFDFRYSARTDCSEARAVLEPRGIRCPKVDHELLGVYIESGIRNNYFPAAAPLTAAAASR